jgi:hypothetical protein
MFMETVTDLADPRRCKASNGSGQCMGIVSDGRDYCPLHDGSYMPPARGVPKYLLARAQDRQTLAALSEDDSLKSLRGEIALTRMMIFEIWNYAKSDIERQNMFGKVRLYVQDLEKLIKTCNQLEERLGSILAKPTLFVVGQKICQALVTRLSGLPGYEQLVDVLKEDIISIIQEARNDTPTLPGQS